ncbi:MAG TPA: DUF309 domain-containing protein [Thermoanaerobaculia bacterium]|jgi:hypothetical protein|nr:DUF309 domain-containing protein [Thermoanaerobaculia bacterium]
MTDDPRFIQAVALFNAGDFFEAGDLFEELFFEAVRDEVPLARVFLQVSVGFHHAEMLQRRPAVERLEEGIRAMDEVTNARGFDLAALREGVGRAVAALKRGERPQPVRLA